MLLRTVRRPRSRASSRSIARRHLTWRPRARAAFTLTPLAAIYAAGAIALAGCGSAVTTASNGRILAVGAENQYANVIEQIGGRYVQVSAIESNPNTDPHTFEASPSVAETVAAAKLIVQNGVGYDTYMNKIESASENSERQVIVAQKLLGLPESTPNPHLWYKPATMPAVAKALVAALSKLAPAHAAYFQANATRFDQSLQPWYAAIARFKARYPDTPVATTEPVGDYMLEAAGTKNETPFALQADIMNGVDPAPQNVTLQQGLFAGRKVKVFVYNQQVTDSLTGSFLAEAKQHGVPVVGVYETMPTPGYDYQTWMLAEVRALERAVADKASTQKL
jgi:zinc/manganese transport system substrate-binding protein